MTEIPNNAHSEPNDGNEELTFPDDFKSTAEWAKWVLESNSISTEAFDNEAPEHREVLKWLFPVFEEGQRRCSLVPEEWDFRGIQDLEEARAACKYEYLREAAWAYEWSADCLRPVGKDGAMGRLLIFALRHKWPVTLWHILAGPRAELFPTPWMKRPATIRRLKFAPVGAAYPITFDSEDREWLPNKSRAHALVIQWDKPDAEIKRALAALVDELRPPELPRVKPPRGRRITKPFDELKWLSAWRLRAAGLSYEEAQKFLKKNAPSDRNPETVIPRYASSGAWQTHAIDKARALIAKAVSNYPWRA